MSFINVSHISSFSYVLKCTYVRAIKCFQNVLVLQTFIDDLLKFSLEHELLRLTWMQDFNANIEKKMFILPSNVSIIVLLISFCFAYIFLFKALILESIAIFYPTVRFAM